jgi:hypothetical protein
MKRYTILAGAALLLPAMAIAGSSACDSRNKNSIAKLTECVTRDGVRAHLPSDQRAAKRQTGADAGGYR